jgi:hypothetical protein
VTQSRWWVVDQPWGAVSSWVSQHQPATVRSDGSSAGDGPTLGDRSRIANFVLPHLPSTVNSAQLAVEVVPLTAHTSAIGAYAVVVRQPARPPAEDVPLTVDRATVVIRPVDGVSGLAGATGIAPSERRILTGEAARRLVRDFDALRVRPLGETFGCPAYLEIQIVTFRAGSQVWRVTNGACDGIEVVHNGRSLPVLSGSNRFSHDMSPFLSRSLGSRVHQRPVPVPTLQTTTVNP